MLGKIRGARDANFQEQDVVFRAQRLVRPTDLAWGSRLLYCLELTEMRRCYLSVGKLKGWFVSMVELLPFWQPRC